MRRAARGPGYSVDRRREKFLPWRRPQVLRGPRRQYGLSSERSDWRLPRRGRAPDALEGAGRGRGPRRRCRRGIQPDVRLRPGAGGGIRQVHGGIHENWADAGRFGELLLAPASGTQKGARAYADQPHIFGTRGRALGYRHPRCAGHRVNGPSGSARRPDGGRPDDGIRCGEALAPQRMDRAARNSDGGSKAAASRIWAAPPTPARGSPRSWRSASRRTRAASASRVARGELA